MKYIFQCVGTHPPSSRFFAHSPQRLRHIPRRLWCYLERCLCLIVFFFHTYHRKPTSIHRGGSRINKLVMKNLLNNIFFLFLFFLSLFFFFPMCADVRGAGGLPRLRAPPVTLGPQRLPPHQAGEDYRHDVHACGPYPTAPGGAGVQVRQHGDGGERADSGGGDVHPHDAPGELLLLLLSLLFGVFLVCCGVSGTDDFVVCFGCVVAVAVLVDVILL